MAITVQVSQLGLACIPDKYAAEVTRFASSHHLDASTRSAAICSGGAAVLGGGPISSSGSAHASREGDHPACERRSRRKLAARNLRQRLTWPTLCR